MSCEETLQKSPGTSRCPGGARSVSPRLAGAESGSSDDNDSSPPTPASARSNGTEGSLTKLRSPSLQEDELSEAGDELAEDEDDSTNFRFSPEKGRDTARSTSASEEKSSQTQCKFGYPLQSSIREFRQQPETSEQTRKQASIASPSSSRPSSNIKLPPIVSDRFSNRDSLYPLAYRHTQYRHLSRAYTRENQPMENRNRWGEGSSGYVGWYAHARRHDPAYCSYPERARDNRERAVATSSSNTRRVSWPYPPKRPRPRDDNGHEYGSVPPTKRAASPQSQGDSPFIAAQSSMQGSPGRTHGDLSLRQNRNPKSNPSSPSLRAILNLDDSSQCPAPSQSDHRRVYRSHSPSASPMKPESAAEIYSEHVNTTRFGMERDAKRSKDQTIAIHPVIAGMSAEQENSLEVLRTTLKLMRSQRALIEAQRGGDKKPSTAWRRGRPRSRPAATSGSESRLGTLDLS